MRHSRVSAHLSAYPLTFPSQISLASNVRRQLSIDCRQGLTEDVERITESHFYSDMLSAFYSCMRVTLHSNYSCLIQLQGSYICCVLVGEPNVSGRSLLSRSFARHLRGMHRYLCFNVVGMTD